ncbi:MAG TPA: NAD(P)H-hydrate dehydratase [Acidobacteriaceae bacterium]|nr:NAD(P)H-hydrate dehydratase [Acidobacteriaceae bacterium]
MQILTAAQMSEADHRSVEQGISVRELMENAGAAVARFCLRHLRQHGGGGPIVVLCGRGNNGGDGLVAARHLARAGRTVRVALLGVESDLKGDAAAAWEAARGVDGLELRPVCDESTSREAIAGAGLIVDAVVGTGFKPPLRGLAVAAREVVAELATPVVAIDLPSGWDADSMGLAGGAEAFRADAVVTFAAPKLAHVFGHLTPGKSFGPVVVAAIGTPAEALPAATELQWAGGSKAVAERPRAVDGNKGRFGHVLIVGGSFGKAGAPSMTSLAAMRAGAGLTTAAVPRDILPMVAGVAPELMCAPLQESVAGVSGQTGLALEQLEAGLLTGLLKGVSVVGIGPGLGQEGATPEFVRGFVERVSLPMVIDADALNAMAGRTELLKRAAGQKDAKGRARTIVLTPHPGEMARLVGSTVKEVEADRVGLARGFAVEHGVVLVLKGWRTLIAHPDGRVAVNTTGNPAMSKGGSGDVLTGIVAGMLAQYSESVTEAVEAAVFLHGLAGDFATAEQNEHTVLATDTVRHLWRAFREPVQDRDGFTWIAGLAARKRRQEVAYA